MEELSFVNKKGGTELTEITTKVEIADRTAIDGFSIMPKTIVQTPNIMRDPGAGVVVILGHVFMQNAISVSTGPVRSTGITHVA